MMRFVLAIAAVGLLLGCGDGSEGGAGPAGDTAARSSLNAQIDGLCDELTGGGTSIAYAPSPTCLTCSAANEGAAIDGQQASFSTLEFGPGGDGPWVVTASAQDGVVFPAGSSPGVVLSAAESIGDLGVVVTTYLDGLPQDSDCAQSVHIRKGDRLVVGTSTANAFDSIEIAIKRNHLSVADTDCGLQVLSASNAQETVNAESVNLHEFCHDFRFP